MFRKPRTYASARPIVPPPSPPPPDPDEEPAAPSSPPSAKKLKLAHLAPTPSKSTPAKPNITPGKPKQSLLTPYTTHSSTKKAPHSSKSKQPKNNSILSFFKPVTPTVRKKSAAHDDDLFIQHGRYELDVSDPEDNDGEAGLEEPPWGRGIMGELEMERGDEPKSPPLPPPAEEDEIVPDEIESTAAGPAKRHPKLEPEADEMVLDEIESTAPGPATPARKLQFNPTSLNLDTSRSFLFSQRGATPSLFEKLKATRVRSSSSSSAEEVGFEDGDGEVGVVEERPSRDIAEFLVAKQPGKRGRGEAFRRDSIESDIRSISPEALKGKAPARLDSIESTPAPPVFRGKAPARHDSIECTPPPPSPPVPKGKAPARRDSIESSPAPDSPARHPEQKHVPAYIDDLPDVYEPSFEEQESYIFDPSARAIEAGYEDFTTAPDTACPLCGTSIAEMSESDANTHVNSCLDGLSAPASTSSAPKTAFSTLMTTTAAAAAWTAATKTPPVPRGSPRTCPFYKLLFNNTVAVDAFRYGRIPNVKAYFLTHFHSDHYIGLTSSWSHGPIYCSRATAALVRHKLGVNSSYLCELPWEKWVPSGVGGIRVRGIDANHCPGSMMLLFEGAGKRILHCGDFRACPEHLKHPLLAPGEKGRGGQKLDVVYLDTTYLNPKYVFPSQESVIDACAFRCVELQKELETGVSSALLKPQQRTLPFTTTPVPANPTAATNPNPRLLVVVGTYSIGKERICIGIARALNTKIFAPPTKHRLLTLLSDPALNLLLTTNPREAQVHMTPLVEIKADTLQEYLKVLGPAFDKVVGFKPSGWSYRGAKKGGEGVRDVLYGEIEDWGVKQMGEGRGGCWEVPYSEHSSFRELARFCCALNIERIVPTVNVGSAKSREGMKAWFEKWETEKRRNGLFRLDGKGGKW